MDIYLREALKEDISDFYKYLNREYVKKYSKREKDEWLRHKNWYKKIITSTQNKLLVINDEYFNFRGLIRYELNLERKEGLVSIFIPVDSRGRGIGKVALKKSFYYIDREKIDKLIAEVLKENEMSFNLFKSIGFDIEDEGEDSYIMSVNFNL